LPIEHGVLQRLAEIARNDLNELFKRRPKRAEAYRDRVLCIALCVNGGRKVRRVPVEK
jgi:hypothetical protein